MLSRTGRCAATLVALYVTLTAGAARAREPDDPSYWSRSREGWFWHREPPRQKPPPPEAAASAPAAATPRTAQERDLEAFAAFRLRFENAIHAATQNPSESNVARFLELYAQARAKASVFADTAQAMAVRMPWIDETFAGSRPSVPSAMAAFDAITMQDRDQLLREMAQSWGLYFFYRANCAYCHILAPQLKLLQEKYGFTVFAVTLDGGVLSDFPHSVRDSGLAQMVADALQIPWRHFVVPAVVLARPASREVVPVGFGAMNQDQMVERITLALRMRERGAGQGSRSAMQALTGRTPASSAVERAAGLEAGADGPALATR